jgi:hypothetical protein
VIAGDDQGRHRQAVDETPCLLELRRLGTLRQVAGDHHQVRTVPAGKLQQPVGDLGKMGLAKMDVGAVQEGAHERLTIGMIGVSDQGSTS